MRPALAIATGAVLLAGTLIVTAPAALLDTRVSALSAGQLRLVNAAGTIWNGSGELLLLPAGARQFVRWQLAAWPLLRGEIRAAIARDPEGTSTATVVYSHNRLELRALEVALPIESVLPLFTRFKLPLGGTVQLQVDHLLWLGDSLDAQLTAQWRDASVSGLQRLALGDLRCDLSGRGNELSGPVRNTGGDVEVTGQVKVAAAGASSVEVVVRPRGGEHADAVNATLSLLGVPDPQGAYHLRWSGAWR
jgi:general secretion pathway protein N